MFITFEGTEGVGKSTNVSFFANILEEKGKSVILTREPGGTEIGEEIRELLLKNRNSKCSATTELLLMFASRAQHVQEKIIPNLDKGKWVISDRFTDASYAYQGGGRGINQKYIEFLEKNYIELIPDYTIILDIAPEVGLKRISNRETDRIEREQLEFFKRVREVYLERSRTSPEKYFVIDASKPIKDVQKKLKSVAETICEAALCS